MSTKKLSARPDDRGRVHLTPKEADSASSCGEFLFFVFVGVLLVIGWVWPR